MPLPEQRIAPAKPALEHCYTLLFLTADFLPSVRLTEDGVWTSSDGASCARADAARGAIPRVVGARAFAV
jgi:hypothetical protein